MRSSTRRAAIRTAPPTIKSEPIEPQSSTTTPQEKVLDVRGYIYPLVPSGRRLKRSKTTILDDFTHLNSSICHKQIFANPNDAPVHSATVVVGRFKYLVTGYFDATLDANLNLQRFSPNTVWRGEVGVFSLGQRTRVKAKPMGTKLEVEEGIRLFIEMCTSARCHGLPPPSQIVSLNGAYDTVI